MMNVKKCSGGRQQRNGLLLSGSSDNCFTVMNRPNGRKPWRRDPRVCFFIFFLWIFTFYPCTHTVAAEWQLVPKIGISGGYDDNIFYTKEEKVDSSIINVQPGIEVDFNSLLSSLRLTADWDILSYLDESDLNRVDQYYRLDGSHRLGERWDGRAGFRFYDDTTLNTYLQETGQVVGLINREYAYATGGISYNISTISSIDTDYIYETARYEDDVFPDYDRHRINLRYRHRLKSEQDVILIGPSYYHRTNDLNDTDYLSLDLGWERDWSDITKTFIAIGARYTNREENDGGEENNWGTRARFNYSRLGIASKITFRYYHDLATLVSGADVNVDNFHLRYDYRLTERFGVGIDGRLVFSYDLFNSDNSVDDNRYYMVGPFVFYRLTENFNMYFHYSYQNNSKDLIDSEDTLERNRVWIEFKYEFPMML